jgi:OFA family oxalate/formate antiporter-like MFS transporter
MTEEIKFMYSSLKDKVFYGWVIVVAGFVMSVIGIGSRYCYGVFLMPLEAEFGITRTATSIIFSIYMILCAAAAVIGGWAMDRFGPKKVGIFMGIFSGLSFFLTSQATSAWQLFITYSLLFSLGTGAIYTIVNSTTSKWFEKKRGLVVGITSSGGGLGAFVMAPLVTYLISNFNWRTAFIILGFMTLISICATALLLKRDPRDLGLLPDGEPSEPIPAAAVEKTPDVSRGDFSLSQACKMSQFWLLGLSWLFLSLSFHLIFVHIVPYAVDLGISAMDGAFILSLISVANVLGRMALGKLSDTIGRKKLAITCALIQTGSLLWLVWARQLWMLYLFAIPFGATFGGSSAMVTALVGDIFGMRNLGAIMGILIAGFALGAAIGPAIGGYVFDVSGQYFMAFAAATISIFLTSCTVALIKSVSKRCADGNVIYQPFFAFMFRI